MRLVRRAGQHGEAEPAGGPLRLVRIAPVKAQLGADPARRAPAQQPGKGVLEIGVVGMEHPLRLAPAEDGKVRVAVDHLRTQDLTVKGERRVDLADQQIDGKPVQRAAVIDRRHPGLSGVELHLSTSLVVV